MATSQNTTKTPIAVSFDHHLATDLEPGNPGTLVDCVTLLASRLQGQLGVLHELAEGRGDDSQAGALQTAIGTVADIAAVVVAYAQTGQAPVTGTATA